MKRTLAVLALSLGLQHLVVACEPAVAEPEALGDLRSGCLVNSDCSGQLVCAFRRCHVECVTTRDCDGGLRCVGVNARERVCQLDDEQECETNADCAPGLQCAADAECRDVCFADDDCIGEQACVRGVCAEPSELDAQGELPQQLPLATCRLRSDCAEGQRCVGGNCQAECREDSDCSAPQRCEAGACRGAGEMCHSVDECLVPGSTCTEGVCRCECREDVDCAQGALCDGCACRPAAAGECERSADCDDTRQCVDGQCLRQCVDARDCPAGLACYDGGCGPPLPRTMLEDAWIYDSTDIEAMRGITDVRARLFIQGGLLTSTVGLEALERVGSLAVSGFEASSSPFDGLSGLREIKGDLVVSSLSAIGLDPAVTIGGNVVASSVYMTCEALQAFVESHHALALIDDRCGPGN